MTLLCRSNSVASVRKKRKTPSTKSVSSLLSSKSQQKHYIFRHDNVVSYKESFIDVGSQTICLVMEYAEDGDMLAKIEQHARKGTQFAEYELWSFLI